LHRKNSFSGGTGRCCVRCIPIERNETRKTRQIRFGGVRNRIWRARNRPGMGSGTDRQILRLRLRTGSSVPTNIAGAGGGWSANAKTGTRCGERVNGTGPPPTVVSARRVPPDCHTSSPREGGRQPRRVPHGPRGTIVRGRSAPTLSVNMRQGSASLMGSRDRPPGEGGATCGAADPLRCPRLRSGQARGTLRRASWHRVVWAVPWCMTGWNRAYGPDGVAWVGLPIACLRQRIPYNAFRPPSRFSGEAQSTAVRKYRCR
jgi:hypothetical protein